MSRSALFAVVTVLLASSLALLSAQSAGAYPEQYSDPALGDGPPGRGLGCPSNVDYFFGPPRWIDETPITLSPEDQALWDDLQDRVRDAMDNWSTTVWDRAGNQYVTFTEVPLDTPGAIEIYLAAGYWLFTGAFASARCVDHFLVFEFDLIYALDQAAGIGTHELGHILDLAHTGNDDNFHLPQNRPTMTTCGEYGFDPAELSSIEHDDMAALSYVHSDQTHPEITANVGFEGQSAAQRLEYWRTLGGTATLSSVVGPGKYNGQAYATVTVGNGGDGIWQRGTLSLAGGEKLQVKGAFRANVPVGDYKLLLVTRPFDYGPPDSCSVSFATYRDWNDKIVHIDYPFQIRKVQTKALTTSWNEVNTAQWTVPHISDFPVGGEPREDGLDYKLWVKKLSPGSMDVDYLRIRLVN